MLSWPPKPLGRLERGDELLISPGAQREGKQSAGGEGQGGGWSLPPPASAPSKLFNKQLACQPDVFPSLQPQRGREGTCLLLAAPPCALSRCQAGCSGTGWSLVQTGGDWRGNCAVNCSKFILEVTFLPLSPMSHLSAVFFSVAGFSWGAFSPFLTPYPSPSGIGISLGGSPCSHGAWFDPTDPTSFP